MSIETAGADETTTLGTVITASGTTNTKGSWTTMIASCTNNVDAILVIGEGVNQTHSYLVDIGTGGTPSAVITDLSFSRGSTIVINQGILVPVAISSGTQISCRCQSSVSAGTVRIILYLITEGSVPFANCTSVVTYGATEASSLGTQIDPGGVAHTKGSYSQITASTSADIQWLTIGIGDRRNGARTAGEWLIDVATGSGGSETVIISDLYMDANTSNWLNPPSFGPFPVNIASGTRIAVRAQSTITDATDRLFDVFLYGANGTAGGGGSSQHFAASFGG